MSALPRVSVVVLNYNGFEDTRNCLTSLAAIDYVPLSIVVVDNASDPNHTDRLKDEFPCCDVLRNGGNLGYAGGNNRGIEWALSHGADWVLLLNNDTVVRPTIIDVLLAAAAHSPRAGIIGPVIGFLDEPDVTMTDGCLFNVPGHDGFFLRKPVRVTDTAPPAVEPVDVVNGCCMAVRADVFSAIGLLDERFFLIHEESDFCLRATRAGFECVVVGSREVLHKGSSAFKRTGSRLQRYYDARNLVLLLRKHPEARRARGTAATMRAYVRYVYFRYVIEIEQGRPDGAAAVLEGLYDALTGGTGVFTRRTRRVMAMLQLLFEGARRWRRFAPAREVA